MKKLFTLLFTFAILLPLHAQQMIVVKNGNTQDVVSIDALRKITFNGTTVTLTQNNGNTIENEMGDIERVYFANTSDIGQVMQTSKELLHFISSDELAVNCPAGEVITIYNISGSQILSVHQSSDGGSISIASLSKGIYLLRAGRQTAKFIKR